MDFRVIHKEPMVEVQLTYDELQLIRWALSETEERILTCFSRGEDEKDEKDELMLGKLRQQLGRAQYDLMKEFDK